MHFDQSMIDLHQRWFGKVGAPLKYHFHPAFSTRFQYKSTVISGWTWSCSWRRTSCPPPPILCSWRGTWGRSLTCCSTPPTGDSPSSRQSSKGQQPSSDSSAGGIIYSLSSLILHCWFGGNFCAISYCRFIKCIKQWTANLPPQKSVRKRGFGIIKEMLD